MLRHWEKTDLVTDTICFPTISTYAEFENENRKELGGLISVYTQFSEEYWQALKISHSNLSLRGIGDFSEKGPLSLNDIFIDSNIILSSDLAPSKTSSKPEIESKPTKLPEVVNEEEADWKPEITYEVNSDLKKWISESFGKRFAVTEVIKRKDLKNIVLLGEPGSGKSIISQYLLLNYQKIMSTEPKSKSPKTGPIVFFIPVRDFVSELSVKPTLTIKDFIEQQISDNVQKTAPQGFVEFCPNSGQVLTIFDGLDEVIQLEDRLKIRKMVTEFSVEFKKSRCLSTSRLVGYTDAMLDKNLFIHFVIKGFDDNQKPEFVKKWYSEREDNPQFRKAAITGLLQALKEPHVAELAENPLLLTIMALVHKAEFDLPKQRALLYDKCAEAFIVNRNKAKDLLFYDENDMKACHEFLGYSMQVKDAKISTYPGLCKNAIEGSIKDPMAISTNELEELLLTYLKGSEELREEDEVEVRDKIKEFLDSASRRIGLLVERGEDVWGFGHRSFQEYFAALYITQNTNGSEELWKEVQNKIEITSWIEPLKLLAGIYGFTNRKALVDFVRKIMEEHRKKDSLDSKRLILAGEIIGEVTLNDKILVRQIASDVIDNFMSTWDLSVFSNLKRVINNFYQMDDVWLNFVNILRKRIILFEMNPTKYLQTMFYGFYVDGRYDDTWIDREIEKLQI